MICIPIDSIVFNILSHISGEKEISSSDLLTTHEKEKYLDYLEIIGYSQSGFEKKEVFTNLEQCSIVIKLMEQNIPLHKIISFLDWKKFETLTSALFGTIGYSTCTNYRFKDDFRKYEIDVLAYKYPYLFVIDCKFHKNKTSFKDSVTKQKERAESLFYSFPLLGADLIKSLSLPLNRKILLLPLLLTLHDSTIILHENIPVIPFLKLKGFLVEIDEFRSDLFYRELNYS